jgi:hypothetical protein
MSRPTPEELAASGGAAGETGQQVDWARWLLGACSSSDPLRHAVVKVYEELMELREMEASARRAVASRRSRRGYDDKVDYFAMEGLEMMLNALTKQRRRAEGWQRGVQRG